MKNLIIISTLFLGTALLSTGCNQTADIDQMLANEESRTEIFNKIAGNQEMMSDFMNHAEGEHGAMMMNHGNDMSGMMRDNPEMMHGTMQSMVKDGEMMTHMMQMMRQEEMISEECMQSMTQMMKDNGMFSGNDMENQ